MGGGGANFFKKLYTAQPVSYALEGPGDILPRPQMKRSGAYFGPNLAVFVFFWTLNGGGGGGGASTAPPLDPPLKSDV